MEEILEVARMAFEMVNFYRLNHKACPLWFHFAALYISNMLKMPKTPIQQIIHLRPFKSFDLFKSVDVLRLLEI